MAKFKTPQWKTYFRRGTIAIAPLALSIAVVYWVVRFLEGLFAPILRVFFGKYYLPGSGVALALIILFVTGIVINNYIIARANQKLETFLKKIPLFNSLYNMVKNVTDFFQISTKQASQQVVVVIFSECRMIGFVTREHCDDLSSIGEDRVAVYLPMSYQIGGFTVFVPRSQIRPLDRSVESAIQQSLIAWAKRDQEPSDEQGT